MRSSTRAVGFVVAAAAIFALALAVGRVAGPDPQPTSPGPHGTGHREEAAARPSTDATALPGGLMVSEAGYTLRLADSTSDPGRSRPVAFTITGQDGAAVTSYQVKHEKRLHLIAVRRDFTGFQHVHPVLDSRGVWRTALDLTVGTWRVFADFTPTGGRPLTLGADLAVTGDTPDHPASDRPATDRPGNDAREAGTGRVARVDGYRVELTGDLAPGTDARLTARITRDGRPVTDLQPYLGAYGHLVALRQGDLAYLHVHPDGSARDGTAKPGPEIVFHTSVPSTGTYQLYLDFRHGDVVRTATFAVTTTGHPPSTTAEPSTGGHHDQH